MLYGSNISVIRGVMTALFGRLFGTRVPRRGRADGKQRAFYPVLAGIVIVLEPGARTLRLREIADGCDILGNQCTYGWDSRRTAGTIRCKVEEVR